MPSGIFAIGSGLSLEGFRTYVEPYFKDHGYEIMDRQYISPYESRDTILASVSGEGDLEQSINKMLVDLAPIIDEKESERIGIYGSDNDRIAIGASLVNGHYDHAQQKRVFSGRFDVLGLYRNTDTASDIFPIQAAQLLTNILEDKTRTVKEHLSRLLDTRLRQI
jgi:hypothetical protein